MEDREDKQDEDEQEKLGPAMTSLHLHTRTISAFQSSPINPSHLLTCSYDSSVRLLDLTTSKSSEVYGPQDTDDDEPLSGIEVDPTSPHVIYFSRLDGFVGRHDTRTHPSEASLWQCSDKKIGGFSIHPRHPHYLATASLDRTVRLWDLRKMTTWEGEGLRPALLGEHTSRLSVSHAAFNSVGQVATSSYDDTIKLYSFEGMAGWKAGAAFEDRPIEPVTRIKHNNQTGRWVTM
jgi:WD40 repeat protein